MAGYVAFGRKKGITGYRNGPSDFKKRVPTGLWEPQTLRRLSAPGQDDGRCIYTGTENNIRSRYKGMEGRVELISMGNVVSEKGNYSGTGGRVRKCPSHA
jgi:hypothetical protein